MEDREQERERELERNGRAAPRTSGNGTANEEQ